MKKVLILTGATATGKTALSLHWGQHFSGVIINADSRQLYRHMDIGTAKPLPRDRAVLPHYLLDVANPDTAFSLSDYQTAVYALMAELHQNGHLPILVGGTGMYITATLEGWQMPEVPPNPELRAQLEAQTTEALFAQFQALDPIGAQAIDRQNPRRLVRALEVCLETGRPFSELRQKHPPDYDPLYFVLDIPRAELYQRADTRVEQMIAAGWVEEVRHLTEDLGYSPTLPAMTALGYPQLAAHLRGELTLETAIHEIKMATHHFIRRQYTWFRGHEPQQGWHWLQPEQDVLPQIEAWLAKP